MRRDRRRHRALRERRIGPHILHDGACGQRGWNGFLRSQRHFERGGWSCVLFRVLVLRGRCVGRITFQAIREVFEANARGLRTAEIECTDGPDRIERPTERTVQLAHQGCPSVGCSWVLSYHDREHHRPHRARERHIEQPLGLLSLLLVRERADGAVALTGRLASLRQNRVVKACELAQIAIGCAHGRIERTQPCDVGARAHVLGNECALRARLHAHLRNGHMRELQALRPVHRHHRDELGIFGDQQARTLLRQTQMGIEARAERGDARTVALHGRDQAARLLHVPREGQASLALPGCPIERTAVHQQRAQGSGCLACPRLPHEGAKRIARQIQHGTRRVAASDRFRRPSGPCWEAHASSASSVMLNSGESKTAKTASSSYLSRAMRSRCDASAASDEAVKVEPATVMDGSPTARSASA